MRLFEKNLGLSMLALVLSGCAVGVQNGGADTSPDDSSAPLEELAVDVPAETGEDALGAEPSQLLGSKTLCLLYPREVQFPTWVFQNTAIDINPKYPNTEWFQISLQAGLGAKEYLWVRYPGRYSRWFGGVPVKVRLETTWPGTPLQDCVNVEAY